MLDPEVIEQKLKEALKSLPSVPIIYASTFKEKQVYYTAEAYYSWCGKVCVFTPGDEDSVSLEYFLKNEKINGDIYFAIPGDKIS